MATGTNGSAGFPTVGTEAWYAAQDARADRDAAIDRMANDAARWLIWATQQIATATDQLHAAGRAGARLPRSLGGWRVEDDGDGGFVVRRAG